MVIQRQHSKPEHAPARNALSLSASGRIRLAVLLAMGIPLSGLLGARPAQAAAFGSPAWFAAQSGAGAQPATASGAASSPASLAASIAASRVVVPSAALVQAQSSINDLSAAINSILQAQNAQASASALASKTASSVTNGLGAGGLVPVTTNAANCAVNYTCNWQNASAPVSQSGTDSSGNPTATVTITQTAQKAILTWSSFNIGQNTTLNFDQSAGTQSTGANNWIALNRVLSSNSTPDQILGKINALGSVYILDPNGIIFGGASQVNVNTLLASSLPLFLSGSNSNSLIPSSSSNYLAYSNQQFMTQGIATPTGTGNILGIGAGDNLTLDDNEVLPGNITVDAGATIDIGKLGFGLLAAPNISNAGAIYATEGQVVLAAGLGVNLNTQNTSAQTLFPTISGALEDSNNGNADATPLSTLTNTGLIVASRGSVNLLAGAVTQSGVVAATTGVSNPGGIIIGAGEDYADGTRTGSLVLSPGSVTAVLPANDVGTTPDTETTTSSPSATTTFQPGSIALTGGAVTLQGNALVEAPGQSVTMTAIAENDGPGGSVVADFPAAAPGAAPVAGRVYIDNGATVDVAGLANIELPMSANLVTTPKLGLNELADDPLQRDSILFGAAVVIDDRISGTTADGLAWVGTPLADLEGYVQAVPQTISQLLQNGGNITLKGADVIAQTGSSLNLSGGYIHYLGGSIQTTELVAANGSVVAIADANPDVQYIGIEGEFVNQDGRWNSSNVYTNPLLSGALSGGSYESDYIQGGNAGTLTVTGQYNTLLEGTITASAMAGRHQVANGTDPSGGTLVLGGDPSALYPGVTLPGYSTSYLVENTAPSLPTGFTASTPDSALTAIDTLPTTAAANLQALTGTSTGTQGWTTLSSALVAKAGFSSVTINADAATGLDQGGQIFVDTGASLSVQPGTTTNVTTGAVKVSDSISLTGSQVTVGGDLSAQSGTISIEGTGHTYIAGSTVYTNPSVDPAAGNVTIGSAAVLDTSGQFVNDSGLLEDQIAGSAFINGGSIKVSTLQNAVASPVTLSFIDDTTGAIDVQAGSLLNVSSGGYIQQSGALAANASSVPLGQGGNISLQTYLPEGNNQFGPGTSLRLPGLATSSTQTPLSSGTLTLDGTLLGYGLGGGGSLTLRTLGIQVGGDAPAPTSDCNCSGTLTLPANYFDQTGFGNITLQAEYNATIASNTTVTLSQYNLLHNLTALQAAGTNTDILGSLTSGGSSTYVSIGQLDSYHRSPVNFSLYGGDYANWQTARFALPTYAAVDGITGAATLGVNSQIVADAGAAITIGSDTQVTIDGSIFAPGGSITLTGDTGDGGYAQLPGVISTAYSSASKSVWLDSAAVLNVAGTTLVNPLAQGEAADNSSGATPTGASASSQQVAGKVLAGGTVTITDDTGYVILTNCMDTGSCPPADITDVLTSKGVPLLTASGQDVSEATVATLPAATINISGATGTLMEPTGVNGSVQATTVVSNAGTLRIGAGEGTYLHANIEAQAAGAITPGVSSTATGGTVYITPEVPSAKTYDSFTGATGLTIGATLPNTSPSLGFGPGDTVTLTEPPVNSAGGTQTAGQLYFSPDLLNNSGVTTLHLGTDPSLNLAAPTLPITFTYVGVYKGTSTADLPGTASSALTRDSAINIDLGAALYLNASDYVSAPYIAGTKNAVATPLVVSLAAPYIDITGLNASANYPNGGVDPLPGIDKSTFTAYASLGMDLGGQFIFDDFSQVNLDSTGDLRLVTPSAYGYYINPTTDVSTAVPGMLETSGALNLDAAQIYPATGNEFAFIAADAQNTAGSTPVTVTPGSITVGAAAGVASLAPLSAGGTLIFEAPTITQDGTLLAPDGQIYLGVSSLPVAATAANPVYDSLAEALLTYNAAGAKNTTVQLALPVISTGLVTLGAGSLTSTSLDNSTVPYGSTVDGQNLVYNGSGGTTTSTTVTTTDLTSAPAKLVSIDASEVVTKSGATVDLSGGGDLQAQEWVAGTGGSRNVLNQVNTSYSTGSAVQVPLYADDRPIYAILPGYNDPLGAYDPSLTGAPLVGQSVYLSGIAGLAAGTYTLLPAQYATLPGAFRVVQDTSSAAFVPVTNQVLADGTDRVAGHFVNSLTGATGNPDAFLVQSGPVWQQYSQYTLTSLNQYFGSASEVKLGAWLPEDAGQLDFEVNPNASQQAVLPAGTAGGSTGATFPFTLPTLITTTPAGAAGAELDIAAPEIMVEDIDLHPTPVAGGLLLDPAVLDSLDLGRLVLGGISKRDIVTNPASGNNPQGADTITPVATDVVINTPDTPLQAPEIVAVSQTNVTVNQNYDASFDTLYNIVSDQPGQGVNVSAGSIIRATGNYNAALDLPIQIGLLPVSDINGNLADVINGDGSLLRVSAGASVTVTRANVPGVDAVSGTQPFLIIKDSAGGPEGNLSIGAGAEITASGSVMVDASDNAIIAPSVQISTPVFSADSSAITFKANSTAGGQPTGLTLFGSLLTELSGIDSLILSSRGSMTFDGNVNINTADQLELSAGNFISDGGTTTITAGSLMLANDLGATATAPVSGTGIFNASVGELDLGNNSVNDLGNGAISFSGFSAINLNASSAIVGRGQPTAFNAGAASVVLTTPLLVAATGSNVSLGTTGDVTVQSAATPALALDKVDDICLLVDAPANCQTPQAALPVGGSLALTGAGVYVNTQVVAPAGTVKLSASTGGLSVGSNASIDVAGVSRSLDGAEQVAAGGSIVLSASASAINVSLNANGGLDIAGVGGGDGGQLSLSAPGNGVTLLANLNYTVGSAAINGSALTAGQGGSFSLYSDSAVNLDTLAQQLKTGDIEGAISVHSGSGNLLLGSAYSLTGSSVSLIADGGTGHTDTSDGNVTVAGSINTTSSEGGNISLFGSSNVDVTGKLLANATGANQNGGTISIGTTGTANGSFNTAYGYEDVSAGNSGGITISNGATISVAGGQGGFGGLVDLRAPLLGNGAVNISAAATPLNNSGARDVSVEAYATWSAADNVGNASHQFDGIIDPAGNYDSTGALLATPGSNSSHIAFYDTTLMGFVQAPGFNFGTAFSGISNFSARAGIVLENPTNTVNNGNISLLSDWNLGAGTENSNGSLNLFYRTNGVAPVLSLLASGSINIAASLSDGFFQTTNPFDITTPTAYSTDLDNSASPVATTNDPLPLITASLASEDSSSYRIVAGADFGSSDPLLLAAGSSGSNITLSGDEKSVLPGGTPNTGIDNGLVFVAPTMVRTGTGSISLMAGGNIALTDAEAPGVIYTAGTASTEPGTASSTVIASDNYMPPFIDTGAVNPVLGGNLSLQAGGSITGITTVSDTDGSRTGVVPVAGNISAGTAAVPASDLTQYWWPWMQNTCVISGCPGAATSSSINFGMFDQGIMSVGGNVQVSAGSNITDLSVSLPTTWAITSGGLQIYGGGNLNLSAGGNLASGSIFVSRGTGTVTVGGEIASDSFQNGGLGDGLTGASTVLGLQDAQLSVQAAGYLDIGGIYDPSYMFPGFDVQSYSASSSVSLTSLAGNIVEGDAVSIPGASYGSNNGSGGLTIGGGFANLYVLPATVNMDALGGGISIAKQGELYPSATGNLSLLATGDINLDDLSYYQGAPTSNTYFGLIDAPASLLDSPTDPDAAGALPSFLDPNGVPTVMGEASYLLHSATPLHADDSQPVQIFSQDGDIIDGESGQNYAGALILSMDKEADIEAGRDVVNLSFEGQNLATSDVTLLEAGRDFYDPNLVSGQSVPLIELGGPGTLDVVAGRNLGPITSVNEASQSGYLHAAPPQYPGIFTKGNLLDAYLPDGGADISVAFGVGGGYNTGISNGSTVSGGFAATYIDPATEINQSTGLPDDSSILVQDVLQYETDVVSRGGSSTGLTLYNLVKSLGALPVNNGSIVLSSVQGSVLQSLLTAAYNDFVSVLPTANQQLLESSVLYGILNQVGVDEANASSPYYQKYGRGYQAINTLFPPALGYTANDLGNGANGAQTLQQTGNFDMRGSTVQTQRGGNISVMGPGGNILVGSESAPPEVASSGITPDTQGILTLEKGDINMFTDGSVLLAQSRIFTEQGGDMLIWSSNGDVNAGKGAKTNSDVPPPAYYCDPDHYCEVDSRSQVSGAGIGVLQTQPDTPLGNATLVAPVGTVDAGAAGVSISGNLTVAAAHVANADNFSVGGKAVGVPTGVVNTAALSAGMSAGNSASQSADPCASGSDSANCPGKKGHEAASSQLEVEVMGYGGGE